MNCRGWLLATLSSFSFFPSLPEANESGTLNSNGISRNRR